MVAERVSQGGALAIDDPMRRMQGAFSNPQQFAAYFRNTVQNVLEPTAKRAQVIQNSIVNNPGRYGMMAGMLPGIGTAISELQEERPVGAAGAVAGGVTGAGIGYGLASMLPGAYGKIAKAALPVIGGMIGAPTGAQGAEYAKRKITNQPTKGKEGELGSQRILFKM